MTELFVEVERAALLRLLGLHEAAPGGVATLPRPRAATFPSGLLQAVTRFIETERRTRRLNALRSIEARGKLDLAAAFKAQGRAFVRRFRAHGSPDLWEPLFHEAVIETRPQFLRAFARLMEAALMAGARSMISDLGVRIPALEAAPAPQLVDRAVTSSFSPEHAAAVDYLNQRGAELVTAIDETTRADIRRMIADGVANGQSYGEIARQIEGRYNEFAVGVPQQHLKSRAELVATNEAAMGYSAGQLAVANDLHSKGIALQKRWLEAGERVCPICEQNAGVGTIPFTDSFPTGSAAPPEHPACRCDLAISPAPLAQGEVPTPSMGAAPWP